MVFRILCVCTGNICRSPTAEAVLRQKFALAGLEGQVEIDSAGTHGYHIGDRPDPRSQRAGEARGYNFHGQRARQLQPQDYDDFDLILAMDRGHLAIMQHQKPATSRAELILIGAFSPPEHQHTNQPADVPDPYYGSADGFNEVLDLIEAAADGVVADVASRLKTD